MAAIGHDDLDDVMFAIETRAQEHFLDRRAFHGFRRVVDQIDDHAPQQFAVGAYQWQVRRQILPYADSLQPPVENRQGLIHDCVGRSRRKLGGGEARELRKFFDQALPACRTSRPISAEHSPTSRTSSGGSFFATSGFAVPLEVARQPLGRKLDRRKRILDFVGDALRHFLPGRRLLRAKQFGQVIDHHHVAAIRAPRPKRAHGYRRVQQPARRGKFQLLRGRAHAQRAPNQDVHVVGRFIPQQLHEAQRLPRILAEDANRRRIHPPDRFRFIDGNNARGNILENGFDQRAAPFQFLHGLLQVLREDVDLPAAVGELLGHAIEGADQRSQFVLGLHVHVRFIISRDDLLRCLGQRLDGNGNLLGQEEAPTKSPKKSTGW